MELSFTQHKLPKCWKEAIVTPIYKKGDKLIAANFRPVSLTCLACKVMEKIIADETRIFLDKENVITEEQHGFVPKRSTITNLLCCLDKWTRNWEEHEPTDIIYLDYEKAFDRVPLKRLIYILEHFGIRGDLLLWIEDFLVGRTFRVRVGENYSEPHNVLSGVPQGSVLGPILFDIFLTDLKSIIDSDLSLFADDTKIMGNPLTKHGVIQNDLDRVIGWTKDWPMTLNIDKCTVLHMGSNNPHNEYILESKVLKNVTHQKDLGIITAHNMKWEEHILTITKRANSLLYLIRKAFFHITIDLFLKIYKVYVRPLLEYGFQIWSPYFKKDIDLFEKVQRRATKMVSGLKNKEYEERLAILGLTTLEERRKRGDLIETYKILTGYYNVPGLKDMFVMNKNRNLRGHSLKLSHSSCTSNPRLNFLPNRVVDVWNKLPETVISAPSVNSFKNRLDKYLKQVQ